MQSGKQRNILIFFLLFAFVFVQFPFAAFHHHEVLECSVASVKHSKSDTHLHSYVNDECFVCSGFILKDYHGVTFEDVTHLSAVSFYFLLANYELTTVYSGHSQSRAPPVYS